MTKECPHPVLEKYVTAHGLVCRDCLTPDDFRRYPGWRERLETQTRRAAQAKLNFYPQIPQRTQIATAGAR